jgi:tRNA (guanine-N7-)-methyltransferase
VNSSASASGPLSAGTRGRWPQSPDEEIHAGGPFDQGKAFGRIAPLEVEIGSGKAKFLLEAARRAPAHDLLGIELSLAYYRICRERIARSGAANARVVRADGRRFVETALAPQSVHAFHIYFPDPWPKKRQRKRRLLDGPFLEILASRLSSGGLVRIATDHTDYGSLIDPLLESVPSLERLPWEALPPPPPTHYELKYQAEKRPIHRFLLRRS